MKTELGFASDFSLPITRADLKNWPRYIILNGVPAIRFKFGL